MPLGPLFVYAPSEADSWNLTEAEIFAADGSLNTRKTLLTRRFVDTRLEKAFVQRTFPLGRSWVRVLLCVNMMYEVFHLVFALASHSSIRWELAGTSGARLCTIGTPLPLLVLALSFTFSRRCTPRTLPYVAIVVVLAWALLILVPNSLAASELTQEIVVGSDGVVHTQIGVLEDFKRLTLQHTMAMVHNMVHVALLCDAAGLSPPATILLGVADYGLNVFLYDASFAARFSPELSVARIWWYPASAIIALQIVQAYVVSALKRRLFLVQLLTAAHRIEQLSREKERAGWQLLLAAAKQRDATGQGSEPSDGEPVGTAQAANKSDVGIGNYSTVLAPAVESLAPLPRIPSGGHIFRRIPSGGASNKSSSKSSNNSSNKSSGASSKSDGEIVSYYTGKPTAVGFTALRHEMMASRRELEARKAATPSNAETRVTIDPLPEPPSFASPSSVATSSTASELHQTFETEQSRGQSAARSQRRAETIVRTRRNVAAEKRPCAPASCRGAFDLALYGQRPPGPMPGQMPAATAEALQVPCRQVMSLAEP